MKANRLSKLSLAIGLSVATTSALASPQAFMSARSFAMGGTGVAVAHPSAANIVPCDTCPKRKGETHEHLPA